MPLKSKITLRLYLTIIMTVIILISILGTGYVLMHDARNALLEEKQIKLFAFAKLLDDALDRTFDEILEEKKMQNASREEKISVLNEELKEVTDFIANSNPGVGVGYYSKELDAIITYGPSKELGHKVGQSIFEGHQGKDVLRTGKRMVQTAPLVRGNIMNCMHPVIRNGEVIGYIWSNELVENIEVQISKMQKQFYFAILLGILFSFMGASFIANDVASKINVIKKGLKEIQEDFSYRIPPIGGDIGEVAVAINEMAFALDQRKKLEAQIQRADRLATLGEIAAGVAHEIRNPLTSIKGFVQFIEDDLPENDEKLEYTQIVTKEVDRLNKIIEKLLFYARSSAFLKIRVDINNVLDSTLLLVNFQVVKPKVQVSTIYNHHLPLIPVDEEQIKQLFLNLIINSAQAIDTAGDITIKTDFSKDKEYVKIEISDTGKGIEEENIKNVFDPFFTTRAKGTGLGLGVAQKISELHDGYIEVSSQVGQGSMFTVYLPIKKEDHRDGGKEQTNTYSG